jgi:hypothetical protein
VLFFEKNDEPFNQSQPFNQNEIVLLMQKAKNA